MITKIEADRVNYLFRRGRTDHIKALYEEGEIYINSIDFIRTCDDNKDRTDEDDGISYGKFIGDAELRICEVGKDFDETSLAMNSTNVVFKRVHNWKGNIYCLSGIYTDHLLGDRTDITFATQTFGESLILIHNPKVFLDRLFSELKKQGFEDFQSGKISYYKHDFFGSVGLFDKHEKFNGQSEYRIFISNPSQKPLKLYIGSLKDIATINASFMRLTYEDGKQQVLNL